MRAICCHGNQTRRQITMGLAIFMPTPLIRATFVLNKGQMISMVLEELSFESVNGRTDRRTDGRRTKSGHNS